MTPVSFKILIAGFLYFTSVRFSGRGSNQFKLLGKTINQAGGGRLLVGAIVDVVEVVGGVMDYVLRERL